MDRTFKALVHDICSQCSADPSKLGAVKLNKILWLSDSTSFRRLGHPITGARYVKQQYGPVPSPIGPVLRELQGEGVLTERKVAYFGKTKYEYRVHRQASADFLSANEKAIVDETIELVCEHHTAASISDATHDHIWRAAADGEEIPLFTAFAEPAPITDEDREWAELQLANAR